MLHTQWRWCCSVCWTHWRELLCIDFRRWIGVNRLKYC